MNSVGYCVTLGPQLRDDEALVVENAIRLAVDSIVNVLFGVNSSRAREYHRVLSDRDKEIQRLETRLRETEEELEVLRQLGCGCGGNGTQRSPSSGDLRVAGQSGPEAVCEDSEEPEQQQQQQQHCEMTLTLGLYAEPPAHVSPPDMESALHPSQSRRMEKETSHAFAPSGMSCDRNVPPSARAPLVVKEEPHDINSVLIKWEMNEDGAQVPPESTHSASVANVESGDGTHFGEIPHVDVQALRMNTSEQIRKRKRSTRTSEPTNDALSLKRAAWRAASRRYYARKVARQQLRPSQPTSFLQMGFSTPMLQDSQRATARGYYGRKRALNQPGDPQGANMDSSHSEGILCS